MTDSYRSLFESRDILPMQRRYGYQPELDFEYEGDPSAGFANRIRRISEFLRNPEQVRSLMGDIRFDNDGNIISNQARDAAAEAVLQQLVDNPKLRTDALVLGQNRSLGEGVGDVYALRSILGEQPALYGQEANVSGAGLRGSVTPDSQGQRRIIEGSRRGQITNEISPEARTQLTPESLEPMRMARDLDVIGQIADSPRGTEILGSAPIAESIGRTARVLGDFYQETSEDFSQPIEIADNAEYVPDFENTREGIVRNDDGSVSLFRNNPQGTARAVREATSVSDRLDLDRLFTDIQDGDDISGLSGEDLRERYDSAFDPQGDLDLDEYDYDNDLQSEPQAERFRDRLDDSVRDIPSQAGAGKVDKPAGVGRIGREDLMKLYGKYIPAKGTEQKINPKFLSRITGQIASYVRGNLNRAVNDAADPSRIQALEGIRDYTDQLENKIISQELTADKALRTAKALSNLDAMDGFFKDNVSRVSDEALQQLPRELRPVDTARAGVGGGEYIDAKDVEGQYPQAFRKLKDITQNPYMPEGFERNVFGSFTGSDGDIYDVKVSRSPIYSALADKGEISRNVLQLLEDKPFTGQYDIGFQTRKRGVTDFDYEANADIPKDAGAEIRNFVQNEGLRGLPGGAILYNSPLTDDDGGSKRSAAYQRGGGFGGVTEQGQFSYLDPDTGEGVPIQPFRQGRKSVRATPVQNTGAYYATLLPGAENVRMADAVQGLREVPGRIKAAPSSLVPGLMDLVPSAQAVDRFYDEGPQAAATQVGKDFVRGVPTGAAIASVLSRPGMRRARGPVAIGAAGLALGEAGNQILKRETGKGVVEHVVAATPEPVKTRLAKAKEVFNPLKGEFGISELLTGR